MQNTILKGGQIRQSHNLDIEIIKIQRSTRTLLPSFMHAHNFLRMKMKWYYKWHTYPFTKFLHYVTLVIYLIIIPFALMQISKSPLETKATFSFDYPRWEWANPKPTGDDLNDVSICPDDPNTIYGVGYYGTIIKTENGGETWQEHYSGTEEKLNYVECISRLNVLVTGAGNTLLQNFGNNSTWTERTVGRAVNKIIPIGDNVFISNLYSDDGGVNWHDIVFNNTPAVSLTVAAFNDTHAIGISGNKVYESNDSGRSWSKISDNSGIATSDVEIATFGDNKVILANAIRGIVTVSSDAGRTWRDQFRGQPVLGRCGGMDTFGELGAIVSCASIMYDDETIMITRDGGDSWESIQTNDPISNITVINESTFLKNSSDYYCDPDVESCSFISYDVGESWSENNVEVKSDKKISSNHFISHSGPSIYKTDYNESNRTFSEVNLMENSLSFTPINFPDYTFFYDPINLIKYSSDGKTAFAVGDGKILISEDAGESWRQLASSEGGFSEIVVFENNPDHAIAVGNPLYTIDKVNGQWTATLKVGVSALNAVTMGSDLVVAGSWVSSDTGATWSKPINITCLVPYLIENSASSAHVLCDNTSKTNNRVIKYDRDTDIWSQSTFSTPSESDAFHQFAVFSSGEVLAVDDSDRESVYYCSNILAQTPSWVNTGFRAEASINQISVFPGTKKALVTLSSNYGARKLYTVDITDPDKAQWFTAMETTQFMDGEPFMIKVVDSTKAVMTVTIGRELSFTTGELLYTDDSGQTWTKWPQKTDDDIYDIAYHYDETSNTQNFLALINEGKILWYHAPKIQSDRLMIGFNAFGEYEDQRFIRPEGLRPSNHPITVNAGQLVPATVYAVEDIPEGYNNPPDTSRVRFTTTDPADTNPEVLQLIGGQGITNFQFHTVGKWTISAYDVDGILHTGTSSQVTVLPADPSKLTPTNSTFSSLTGQASAQIVKLQDLYGNDTAYNTEKTVTLSSTTSNSSGRFSTSSSGPWTPTLSFTLPASTNSFTYYYLDYTIGTPTITSSITGITPSTQTATIGQNGVNSTFNLGDDTIAAGSSTTLSLNLHDKSGSDLIGKVVTLTSSRNTASTIDAITASPAVTDSSGNASFTISSNIAGHTTLTLYDQTDQTFITDDLSLTFNPNKVTKIVNATPIPILSNPDNPLSFDLTLKDSYGKDGSGNTATNARGTLTFSSTDKQAVLPSPYTFTSHNAGHHTFSGVYLRTMGNQTINLSYTEGHNNPITLSFSSIVSPSSVSAHESAISSDKTSLKADGQEAATIVVTLTDSFNNPIEDKQVKLQSSRKEDTIVAAGSSSSSTSTSSSPTTNYQLLTTNSDGEAIFRVRSKTPGKSLVGALDVTDSLVLSSTVSLNFRDTNFADTIVNTINPIISNPVVNQVIKKVLKPVSQAAAAAGALTILVQGVATLPSIFQFFAYLFALLGEALGLKRRPKNWGVVFDSISGKPIDLAVVRLFNYDTKALVATRVSDLSGRFGFSVGPGNYFVSVTKPGYLFPVTKNSLSNIARGQSYYVGTPLKIERQMDNLSLTIPIEPIETNLNFFSKAKIISRAISNWVAAHFIYILLPFLLIGIAVYGLTAYVTGEMKYYYIMDIYIAMIGFYTLLKIRSVRNHGLILGQKNKKSNKLQALTDAIVYLFDAEFETLRSEVKADKNGRFTIFAPKGKYYLTSKADGYKMIQDHKTITQNQKHLTKYYEGGIIDLKHPGYINVVVRMEKV